MTARSGALVLAAMVCLVAAGCGSRELANHATAVAAATAPVVDQATAAYQAANTIHDMREDYDAIAEFDQTDAVYNPHNVEPLLSQNQLEVRLTVLKALQVYVQSLVAVTNGTESPALDAAAKSAGGSLTALVNQQTPEIESGLGIVGATVTTTTTSSSSSSASPEPLISQGTQNALSTGINALGQYLVSRKVKQELPGKVEAMDGQVKALCELLAKEIDTLASQEKIDYDSVINRRTLFLRTARNIDPGVRQEEIMKLPQLARQERAALQQLAQLRGALVKLELTHHALAADAQGNNPESLKNKIGDLAAAGSNLGKFYSSLPGTQ